MDNKLATVTRIREPKKAELDRLVSLAIAAQHLGCHDQTLRRMIDRRQLHAVKIGHGRGTWRIAISELQRIIAEGTIPV